MGFPTVHGTARLAEMAGQLKEVRRQGWVDRGVDDAESVADHSYRVAVLAWAIARGRGLDADRAMRIALIHDLAEAEVGDETPFDDVLRPAGGRAERSVDPALFDRVPPADPERKRAKHARERAAIDGLAAALGAPVGDELRAAWVEYESQATPEARLVKELDRIETLLQAETYAARQPGLPIGSFRAEVAALGLDDDLAALVRTVEQARSDD
jgi:putative hydrolase of HD superfamily